MRKTESEWYIPLINELLEMLPKFKMFTYSKSVTPKTSIKNASGGRLKKLNKLMLDIQYMNGPEKTVKWAN